MNKLTDLQLEEVSLVDEGANPAANVILFKRKEVKTVDKNTETKLNETPEPTVDAEKTALQKRVAELAPAVFTPLPPSSIAVNAPPVKAVAVVKTFVGLSSIILLVYAIKNSSSIL